MSLVHDQELPAPVHEVLLVPHANLIGGHDHRKSLLTDWLIGCALPFPAGGWGTLEHALSQFLAFWLSPMIEHNRNLHGDCTCTLCHITSHREQSNIHFFQSIQMHSLMCDIIKYMYTHTLQIFTARTGREKYCFCPSHTCTCYKSTCILLCSKPHNYSVHGVVRVRITTAYTWHHHVSHTHTHTHNSACYYNYSVYLLWV